MRGGKRTRPLGALRNLGTPEEAKVQLPKPSVVPKIDDEKLDESYSGIQGNAMSLPTPKEPPKSEERRKSVPVNMHREPKPVPVATPSTVSHEACEKELKEVLVSFWSSIDL